MFTRRAEAVPFVQRASPVVTLDVFQLQRATPMARASSSMAESMALPMPRPHQAFSSASATSALWQVFLKGWRESEQLPMTLPSASHTSITPAGNPAGA